MKPFTLRSRYTALLWTLLLFGSALSIQALCPHEVLVLANEDSIDSVMIARRFMRMRGIPDCNLVRLTLPEAWTNTLNAISTNDFNQHIWDPAQAALDERGLRRQILCWVYSTDFPYRIKTQPNLSITGLTFLRGQVPDDLVHTLGEPVQDDPYDARLTLYASPLFAGPEEAAFVGTPSSKTFDQWRLSLLEDMPIPAMMLGWTGPHGNTVDEVIHCLKRGKASDATHPDAAFCVYTNQDVRSTAREWEMAPAARDLASLGTTLEITPSFPLGGEYAGFLTGVVDLPASEMTLSPGAFAEHFTSYAAAFHKSHQTKMTEWIRRGATATSGTVTEPYAYWQKFPHASLFWHQRQGCTMIEAFYQAVRCPLQQLPIGDPLARPWGKHPNVRIQGATPNATLSGQVTLQAIVEQDPDDFRKFEWLIDGRLVARTATLTLDTTTLSNGNHTLRAVVRGRGPVRDTAFTDLKIHVQNAHSTLIRMCDSSPLADATH